MNINEIEILHMYILQMNVYYILYIHTYIRDMLEIHVSIYIYM